MGTPWDMLKAFLLTASAWFSAEGFSFGVRGVGPVVKGKSG